MMLKECRFYILLSVFFIRVITRNYKTDSQYSYKSPKINCNKD